MKILISVSCCALFFAGALGAQPQWLQQFAFNVGGGYNVPFLTTKTNLAPGWNAQGGIGYNFTRHLAIMAEIEYDQFRINDKALNTLGNAPGVSRAARSKTSPSPSIRCGASIPKDPGTSTRSAEAALFRARKH